MAKYIPCEACNFSRGDYIDNKYLVEKKLGEGTFGQVFKVSSEGKEYALKILKLWKVEVNDRERLVNRFDMEFHTGQINSNYLTHSYFQGNINGNPYIVMEYCGEGNLKDRLDNAVCIDVSTICLEVLYGLKDLHSNGKNHRDLKPENVLFRNGTAVLTDFGISGDKNNRQTGWGRQFLFGSEKPDEIFGTYIYIPPEQLNPPAKEVTILPTNDIFSFGVMAYEMLTGKLPFGILRNDADLAQYNMRRERGAWDRQTLENVAPNWVKCIERCICADFKQRIQSVDETLTYIPQGNSVKRAVYQPLEDNDKSYLYIRNGVQLRIMQGEEYGKIYQLESLIGYGRRIITIGRRNCSVKNSIEIKEEDTCFISRRHCTIEIDIDSGHWIIRDGQWLAAERYWKDSTNGTFVNSRKVGRNGMVIIPGDIITIGDTKIRVEGY